MFRHHLFSASTALVLLTSAQAGAQQQSGQAPSPTTDAAAPVELQEVIVTALKRPEKLADAPVAATVLSGSALDQDDATEISDINKLVPSVNLNGSFNGRVPFGIRGISTVVGEGVVGFSSGVAVMIDGVPVPSDSVDANDLDDVAQLEVLKGPQGTLGGSNAASGLINIVTRSPQRAWDASASATFTGDGEQRGSLFVTGPLNDDLAFSLSTYGSHIEYPITNLATGQKSYKDAYGARGKVLYQPTANLDVTLTAHVAESDSHGENFVYSYLTPGATLLFPGSPLTQAKLLPGITPSVDNESYDSPVTDSGSYVHDGDASLDVEYHLGDYTLSSITAYQRETQRNIQDLFAVAEYFWQDLTGGMAPPFYNYMTQWETNRQTSEELKFTSPADLPLSFVSGLFYSDTVINQSVDRDLIPALENLDVVPDTSTYDAYGQTTWKFRKTTSLVTGLRLNHDRIGYTYDQIAYTPQTGHYSAASTSSNTLVGRIALQQTFGGSSMGYIGYSRGYSPKAYNTSFVLASNAPLTPVGAEQVNDFELGVKSALLDQRANLDVAAFDTIYDHYQIETFESLPGYISPPTVLTSAGKAETRGLELDSRFVVAPALRATFNAAYVNAKWDRYTNDLCYGGQTVAEGCITDPATGVSTQNASGKAMPNAPKFKFDLGLQQTVPLPALPVDLVLDGNYSYRSSAQMLPDLNPEAIEGSYGILDLGATLLSRSGRYSLRFFANNVLDRHYVVDMEDFWSSVWVANAVIAEPARDSNRYLGVTLNVNL
jgi:iron complex outermembrane recepter protein